ncbi:MAG TPA: hypothetical protein VIJ68_02310 [Candidatus Saccharimonadales bacterium]
MDVSPGLNPITNRAVVRFDNEAERVAFGEASPFLSAENFRRLNSVKFNGLLSLSIFHRKLYYDTDPSSFPQEATFTHRVLGHVAETLKEQVGSGTYHLEDRHRAQDMAGNILEYLTIAQGPI